MVSGGILSIPEITDNAKIVVSEIDGECNEIEIHEKKSLLK